MLILIHCIYSYLTWLCTAVCRDDSSNESPTFVCICSPSYGATYLDAELLQRQSYTTTHQLPTYTTSHIPVATGELWPYNEILF